ncbi:UNVERIFIED_CONTAM: hypothetical protein FKN15_037194 [Acipenser sinensis]
MVSPQCEKKQSADGTRFGGQCVFVFALPSQCRGGCEGTVVCGLNTDNGSQVHSNTYTVRQQTFHELTRFVLEGQAEGTTERYVIGPAIPQGLPLSHSERGKANTPSSPPLRVTAMTDRRIYEAAAPFLQYHACTRQSTQFSPVTGTNKNKARDGSKTGYVQPSTQLIGKTPGPAELDCNGGRKLNILVVKKYVPPTPALNQLHGGIHYSHGYDSMKKKQDCWLDN